MTRDHSHSSIQRKNQNTKTPHKILLYVEGKNTEPSYFDLLKRSNCKVIPVTIPGQGIGSCVDFVNTAKKKYDSFPEEKRRKYKQIWVVFDCDGRKDFSVGVKLARNHGFRVAFSNMCIEYWFMLHFYNHNGDVIPLKGSSHSEAHIDEINKFIERYNKCNKSNIKSYDSNSKKVEDDFFDLMLAIDSTTHNHRIVDACQRAMTIHLAKKKNGAEFSESVTTMYELMEELGTVKKDKAGSFLLNNKL